MPKRWLDRVAMLAVAAAVAMLLATWLTTRGHAQTAKPPAIGVVRVTESPICQLPALPNWTRLSTTGRIDQTDIYMPHTDTVTYLRAGAAELVVWQQRAWTFAISSFGGAAPVAAEAAFARLHLPGRGSLVWLHPDEWQVRAAWCARGHAYSLHIANLNPAAAALVAAVISAWVTDPGSRFRCRSVPTGFTCHLATVGPSTPSR